MECRAFVENIFRSFGGDYLITLRLDGIGLTELEGLNNSTPYRLKLLKWTEKRSLDANAYFHVLCDKLRQAAGVSMANMKNDLITTYGQIEYISEGVPLIYKTNAPPEFMQEREEVHMKYIKASEDGGYYYRVYRGSHTYNSAEMNRLIEGTIAECKVYQIEVLPPAELQRMKEAWNENSTPRQ